MPPVSSMVPVSLDQVTRSRTSARADQCTLSAPNNRTTNHSSGAADQCTFQLAMARTPIVSLVPALAIDAADNSN